MSEEKKVESIPAEEKTRVGEPVPEQGAGVGRVGDLPSSSSPAPRVEEKPAPRGGHSWLNAALVALLILSLGFSAFVYVDSGKRVSDLSG